MQIRNKSADAREVTAGEFSALIGAGEAVEVPDEIANGTPPTGDEGSPEFRAGTSGLLAQADVWEKASSARSKHTDETPSGEED